MPDTRLVRNPERPGYLPDKFHFFPKTEGVPGHLLLEALLVEVVGDFPEVALVVVRLKLHGQDVRVQPDFLYGFVAVLNFGDVRHTLAVGEVCHVHSVFPDELALARFDHAGLHDVLGEQIGHWAALLDEVLPLETFRLWRALAFRQPGEVVGDVRL